MQARIALAACVVLGCGLCGRAATDAVRRRARTLCSLADGIRALRVHMIALFEPVQYALERTECALLTRVAGAMDGGKSADAAWRSVKRPAVRRGGAADALAEEDIRVLDRLFEGLGQSVREEQEGLLGGALQAVERLRDGALEKAGQAERIYVSISLLIGLMLAIIVI